MTPNAQSAQESMPRAGRRAPTETKTLHFDLTHFADGALCFLLNDGRYVGFQSGYLTLVGDLSSAEGFSFLGVGDDEPFDFKPDVDRWGG